ncbi:MAG: type II toxin-antitoxin system VapB family antitoxin [Anaerolineales bacterium]|nr:type II toxin-antitoxin system VapB family antitoxin [Anaerolineales bacterium]
MRTTIRLDDDLLIETKKLAARLNKTLTAVIEDALRETLSRQKTSQIRPPVNLITVKGRGLQPGVDLDDSAALLSLMEESLDPS